MSSLKTGAIFAVIAVCSLCAAIDPETPWGLRYRIEIKDLPRQKRFEVRLISLDDRKLCLRPDRWPNRFGQLDARIMSAVLQTEDRAYPLLDHRFQFWSGSEVIVVEPGRELTGFVNYAEFGDPSKIAKLPQRRLNFIVAPFLCH